MNTIILCAFSYIIGSIPNALWIGKVFKNIDIREHGSGNTGATNAARVLGKSYGLVVLILDALKGFLPTFMAVKMNANFLDNLFGTNGLDPIIVGVIAILGHTYSAFLKLKGGKGVATTLGVFLVLAPKVIIILLFVFIIVLLISKYVSLASILCAILLPILTIIIYKNITLSVFALIMGLLVVFRHKSNIKNLLNGTENKFIRK